MEGKRRIDRRGHVALLLFPCFLAQTLFLWMFFSAARIEQTARLGSCSAGQAVGGDADARARLELVADRFAAQWRHGMADNSPLYMPGFFALGITTWFWSIGRPLRRLGWEALLIVLIAAPAAALLTPLGGDRALQSFEMISGYTCPADPVGFTWAGAAVAIYTIFFWNSGMLCCQLAIARRSIRPMVVPLILGIIIWRIRPWTVNDFVTQWYHDVLKGLPVAVVSLLAIPAVACLLIGYQLRRQGSPPYASTATG